MKLPGISIIRFNSKFNVEGFSLFEEGMIKGREAISLNLNLTKEKETSSGSKIKLLEPK